MTLDFGDFENIFVDSQLEFGDNIIFLMYQVLYCHQILMIMQETLVILYMYNPGKYHPHRCRLYQTTI